MGNLGNARMTHLRLYFFLFIWFGTWILSLTQSTEEFSEELLLRPLPDGKVLTHFHFTNKLPPIDSYGHHHRLFPKAIYQLVQKFRIQEMEISFTQGRWNYDKWGGMDPVVTSSAKPSGVELWAVFGVPDDQIDGTWGNLTHALSGLFCSSLNFLASPAMVANPVCTFRPDLTESDLGSCIVQTQNCQEKRVSASSQLPHYPCSSANGIDMEMGNSEVLGRVRYGALPREAVCTENLTPWLKLLPCRDKAGLATLLDRPVIYKGWYHSLRLYVRSYEFEPEAVGGHKGTLLQQALTLVIQPSQITSSRTLTSSTRTQQPTWSLSSLFGRDISSGCPLAKSNVVYLEFEGPLVEKLGQLDGTGRLKEGSSACMAQGKDLASIQTEQAQDDLARLQGDRSTVVHEDHCSALLQNFVENGAYVLHGVPENIFRELRILEDRKIHSSVLLAFTVPKFVNSRSLDVGISWKIPFAWKPIKAPFRATRFLVGSGNARGAIAIVLKSNELQSKCSLDIPGLAGPIFRANESPVLNATDMTIFQVVPWYIRLYLHTLQVYIDEQPKPFWEVVTWMQVIPSEDRRSPGVIELELRIPCNATVITLITEFDKGFLRIDEHPPDANRGFDLPSALISFPHQHSERQYQPAHSDFLEALDSPLLQHFRKEKPVQVYTEVLLVPLATPDFSMPYNVITLTCTVLALYFGSLLNILRRRIGEEERLANSREALPSKLEQLLAKIFRRSNGPNKEAAPSKIPWLFKVLFVAVVAVIVKYYFANE